MSLVDRLYTKLTQGATVQAAEARVAEATGGMSREEAVGALSLLLAIEHFKARYANEKLQALEKRREEDAA